MIKRRKAKKKNQGNSFIMVVATVSFLAVLVAAILVAVALCYRLKAYDINSRDNFYYLEQAMDEIYAGVGADAMTMLNKAYDDTIEVLVYFDPVSKSYVTMDDDEANRILKSTYMKFVKADKAYTVKANTQAYFCSLLSNPYEVGKSYDRKSDTITAATGTNDEGIKISLKDPKQTDDSLTVYNLVLTREAKYSTVNTRKSVDNSGNITVAGGDTFVQSITTDLVIGKPEFNVNFNTIGAELNDLYKYAFVADKGIEIGGSTTKVNITGDVYAASDFYNKSYNDNTTDAEGNVTHNSVSSYENGGIAYKSRLENCDGIKPASRYSGFYVDGAEVVVSSNTFVVPGSIAAMNSGTIAITAARQAKVSEADVWADNIITGGYSLYNSKGKSKGSSISLRANAYIYDDLELNAKASSFQMAGGYYGYNYASTDNRTYTETAWKASNERSFGDKVPETVTDGYGITGQAHYNSSSIIVNGEDSQLDLSDVNQMYIAGQAYIETSKATKENTDSDPDHVVTKKYSYEDENGNPVEDEEFKSDGKYDTYSYPKMVDKDGTADDDNYTNSQLDEYSSTSGGGVSKSTSNKTTQIQDYRTGEAISIKSNQLAYNLSYIRSDLIKETSSGIYLQFPDDGSELSKFLSKYWDQVSQIPIIKTKVSGKVYYFYDFAHGATGDKADLGANDFIAEYAKLFNEDGTSSVGSEYLLPNITNYSYFKVDSVIVNSTLDPDDTSADKNYKNIYSNSAITVKDGTKFTIKAKSSSLSPLLAVADNIDTDYKEQALKSNNEVTQTGINATASSNASVVAGRVTAELQNQYKEVKYMLTTQSSDPTGVTAAHGFKESEITPINYFFNFALFKDSAWSNFTARKLNCGYYVWLVNGDVNISKSDVGSSDVKGLIICKGDVTFDEDIKSFEGLIVTGSKIMIGEYLDSGIAGDKVRKTRSTATEINLSANEEIVKTILRECDQAQGEDNEERKKLKKVCEMFKNYEFIYQESSTSTDTPTENVKNISAVQFEDILSFENWKKNVD